MGGKKQGIDLICIGLDKSPIAHVIPLSEVLTNSGYKAAESQVFP